MVLWAVLMRALLVRAQIAPPLCGRCGLKLERSQLGESICRCHTHLIPARDYAELNEAVFEASLKVLDPQLAQMLLTLAASHRPRTEMPLGQAALIWLNQNMPRTAERVLGEMRAQLD